MDHQCPMGCEVSVTSCQPWWHHRGSMAALSVTQGKLCVIKGAPEPAGRSSPNGCPGSVGWRSGLPLATASCPWLGAGCQVRVCPCSPPQGWRLWLPRASPVCSGRGVCVCREGVGRGVLVHPPLHRTAPTVEPGSIPVQETREHRVLQLSSSHRPSLWVPSVPGSRLRSLREPGGGCSSGTPSSSPKTLIATFPNKTQNGNRSSCQGISTPNQ